MAKTPKISFFGKLRIFFQEMVVELKKAAWPSTIELRDSSVVVLVAIVLLGIYITLSDFSSYNWVTFLTNVVTGGQV